MIPNGDFSPGVLDGLALYLEHAPPYSVEELASLKSLQVLQDSVPPRGLEWLPNLKILSYRGCEHVLLGALGSRPKLKHIMVWSSHLADILALPEVAPNLEDFEAFVTSLTDIRPLLGLAGLEYLTVAGCPLDEHSYARVLPELTKRGVQQLGHQLNEPEFKLMRRFSERGLRLSAFEVQGRIKVACPGHLVTAGDEMHGLSYATVDGWLRLLDANPDADERALFAAAQEDPERV